MPQETIYSPHPDGLAVIVQWDNHQEGEVRIGTRPADQPGEGYFLQLSRGGINAVIRALKKAGVKSYGKDEW